MERSFKSPITIREFALIGVAVLLLLLVKCNGDSNALSNEKHYKDVIGRISVEKKVSEVSKRQLKKYADSLEIENKGLKSIAKITSTSIIYGKGRTIMSLDTIYIDSTRTVIKEVYPRYKLKVKNKWEDIYIDAGHDTITYKFKSTRSLVLSSHEKNGMIMFTATEENPNTVNLGVKQMQVRIKDQLIEVEPSFGLYYNMIDGKVGAGPGVSVNLDIKEFGKRVNVLKRR